MHDLMPGLCLFRGHSWRYGNPPTVRRCENCSRQEIFARREVSEVEYIEMGLTPFRNRYPVPVRTVLSDNPEDREWRRIST